MARPELGIKRTCPTTGRKFYDLNRDPIVSPYTGEIVPRAALELPRRGAAKPAPVEEEEEEVVPETADVELVSLEETEASAEADTADGDEDVEIEGGDDDTFLETEEEDDDDLSDVLGDGIDTDEEP